MFIYGMLWLLSGWFNNPIKDYVNTFPLYPWLSPAIAYSRAFQLDMISNENARLV